LKYNERGKSRIEVSDILNYFKDINSYYNDCTRYDTLKRMLEDIIAETKEDAERKTGRWIDDEGNAATGEYCATCSACGEWSEYLTAYCPNCGARME